MGEPVTGESQRFISENMRGRGESGRMIDGTETHVGARVTAPEPAIGSAQWRRVTS